jgi:hypothetical protein
MTLQRNSAAVRRFGRLMKFATWLQDIPNKVTPPPFRLMQIGSAFWQSRALYVAARLDLAGALGDERLAADAIAARVGCRPDATYRLLRMLAAMGVFEEVTPRVFRNNKLSACLREDNAKNVRAMILMHNSPEMSRPWFESLEQGLRNGAPPFHLTHGQDLYAYMDRHPSFDALFARAMDSVDTLVGDSYATDFAWARYTRVIDVGGSKGSKSVAILRRHPHVRALVVDRPQVIQDARQHWAGRADAALLARLTFQAGDLLDAVPAAGAGDIYLVSAVLHGFDDATCVQALRNLASASGRSGAPVALLELVLPESRADMASAAFDMQMFMATGGRERTLTEWRGLFDRSGLVLEEEVTLRSMGNILVLRPSLVG